MNEPTIVEIGDGLRIRSDGGMNWMVEERRITGDRAKEPGMEAWGIDGYHGRLEGALEACLNKGLSRQGAVSVAALLQAVKNAADRVAGAGEQAKR